nr:maleylpyruvate isomerase family mycothiol-dependent enzyme [uncultured Nocardioides sp.]
MLILDRVVGLRVGDLSSPSLLPTWSRAHVVAHLASNAKALGNLVHWAATGVATPMYASLEQRRADIDHGAQASHEELLAQLRESAATLESAMDALTPVQWEQEVTTVQGRTVPASEIAWLRAREVCVHAVDLDVGLSFDSMPDGFVAALIDEITGKRGLLALPDGSPADLAAWLSGRPHSLVAAPTLDPWL